ncbi:hypothetical protein LPU83_pLPU83d_0219 (plasmid) [Rhizobium favelukesii]|uniref:N-acetyltransferase domain-containing protein n=1 Tax=Rhizobium favelukesii TaxID=348824 RepID=W6RMZ9_9HYPH|nr:hypothetical protein LPU83_pLPU83d_0219 [Rhizobium favelukesii]
MSEEIFRERDGSTLLRPISSGDVQRVADFLHAELNGRLSSATWASAIRPSWQATSPNHGYMLVSGERIVGVYVAFYSARRVGESVEKFCNLSAWCVLDGYRAHGLRLLKALLDQGGYTFTDLSPSGNVVPLNRRLKFQQIDTAAALVINLPRPSWGSGVSIVTDPRLIERHLDERNLGIYKDHVLAPAAHHLAVIKRDRCCYVIFRKDTRKRLRVFASILHVGDRDLFAETAHQIYSYLLTRFGVVATFVEDRFADVHPKLSISLRSPRPKMFLSDRVSASEVDYLYSELTCVPW